jgi:putative PIG3 family NAD(P)H quinone oxidoreductase
VKAIVFDQPGGPEVLRWGDAPDPQPAEGELLVRVHATSANRADTLQRRGNYPPPEGASPILGLELAGEVVEGVGEWQPGDRVMAVVAGGGYAELAAVPAGMAIRIPERLSFEQAAAIPEAFLTAFLNLFTLGQLKGGERVLIHAGASGVGTAAIQLARTAGAHVLTTAGSDEKLMRCRELGAQQTINYKRESFRERVAEATGGRGVDLILDFVGAPYWDDNLASLALDGRLALIGFLGGSRAQLDLGPILGKRLHVFGTTLRRTPMPQKVALTDAFAAFALARFDNGELQPVIDSTLPLEEAAEAHRLMESNNTTGKIVLRMG